MPEIPLSYYEFKKEQEYDGEDLEMRYATTDPKESSDDDTPIVKPCSNIKKVAHIVRVESKRAKKLPTKRAAAELGCQLLSNSNLILGVQNTGTFPCYCDYCVY